MQGSSRIDELRQKFHENPRRYFAPLANEYRKAGDPEQAIAICRAHLAQQPGHMSGHVVYGQALFDARRPDEARTVFEKALALDPDNAIVVRHLGDIAREKGDTNEARHWYGKALDLDPGDKEVAAYVAELTEPLVGDQAAAPEASETAEAGEPAEPAQAAEPAPAADGAAAADSVTPAEPAAEPVEAAQTLEAVETPEVVEIPEPDIEVEAIEPVMIADAEQYPGGDLENEALDVIDPAAEEAAAVATPAEPQGDGADPESREPREESDREVAREVEAESIANEIEAEPIASEVEAGSPAPDIEIPVTESEVDRAAVPADVEVALPDAAEEPGTAAPESEDVAWRKTPRPEDSPFVTRTMAELYARQGYRAAALDVYRQLAIRHPEDADIRDRIAELTGERDRAVAEATPVAAEPPHADRDEAPPTTSPVEATSEPERADELSDEPAFAPSAEDLNVEIAAPVPDTSGLHFTETEISDTPLEGAMELDSESPFGELSWEIESVSPESTPEPEPVVEPEAKTEPEPIAEPEPVAEPEAKAEPEPIGEPAVSQTTVDAAVADVPATLADARTGIDEAGAAATSLNETDFPPASDTGEAESIAATDIGEDEAAAAMAEPEPAVQERADEDDRGVVAYSPEPPQGSDLPHFTPRGPTVREFFAALGAYRPPAGGGGRPITASAAMQAPPAAEEQPEDLPLATDAFSSLFADAPPVSEEDTRAAFALSGALSSTAHNPNPSSLRTSPPRPAPAVPEQPSEETRESEEDIRRFREWLDGLADS